MTDDWRSRAKCSGQDPRHWETSQLQPGVYATAAAELCDGCPVLADCGRWMLALTSQQETWMCGVVVAGVALPERVANVVAMEDARRRIAERIGVEYSPAADLPEAHDDDPMRWLNQPCVEGCGRTLTDSTAFGFPRGVCPVCEGRKKRREAGIRERVSYLGRKCLGCGLTFTARDDGPGTVKHRTGGRCEECYLASQRKGRITFAGKPCLGCGKTLCSHKPASEGQVRHGSQGYCQGCFYRLKRDGVLS